MNEILTSLRCRWQTRATLCLRPTVLYTDVDGHRCDWWLRPSPVYHTDRPTKLIAPETISRSRDMVGAHQNLNGLRDLATPVSGQFAIRGLALATISPCTKFEVSVFINYVDMTVDTKCQK